MDLLLNVDLPSTGITDHCTYQVTQEALCIMTKVKWRGPTTVQLILILQNSFHTLQCCYTKQFMHSAAAKGCEDIGIEPMIG